MSIAEDTERRGRLPAALQEVVDEFADAPRELVLELLVEYADVVPDLPAHLADHPELLEPVPECQTPFFLRVEVADDERVVLWFKAPPEAPTTRAFAGILAAGLAGATATEVLDVPDDFYLAMGLGEVISPLRLRGMAAILGRTKRQIREQLGPNHRAGSRLVPGLGAARPGDGDRTRAVTHPTRQ